MSKNLIVFDGVCVLCCGFFRFMLRHDHGGRFRFATAQSDMGQACYAALGLPLDDFQTNLVIKDGWVYTDLDAFAAAMSALARPFAWLRVLGWLPGILKRSVYRLVARNRYALFGRYEACLLPDKTLRARFIEGGWAQ